MNNSTLNLEDSELGLTLHSENTFVFFGKNRVNREMLQKKYPDFHFQQIRQTHSDIVIESSDEPLEADSHYSSLKNIGLLISTADCIPALIYCRQTGRVAAVHAGWKGVANQIIFKTLKRLQATGSDRNHFEIWLGPHILQNSFEVDLDVLKKLDLSTYRLNRDDYCYEENKKYYVDLSQIVESQVREVAKDFSKIHVINIDTKTNLDFCSFRRDKEKAERNLSFIVAL